MIRKINSNNPNFKFLNLTDEEYFEVFNKEWSKGNTFRKYRGFAVQTEKGENNTYFPTKVPSKYEEVNTVNGKEVIKQQAWTFKYKNVLDAFKAAKNYKQVIAGRTHYNREVMVCDCDHDFLDNTVSKFNSFCDKYDIPRPTCFVVNPVTNHYQVHWYLDNGYEMPYNGKFPERMHVLRHEINLLLDGDQNFTGGFIKNPYFDGLNTIWNNYQPISRVLLESRFERAFVDENEGISYHDYKKLQKDLKKSENKVDSKKKAIVKKLSKKESSGRSRHMESFENARTDSFAYMRENNGKLNKDFIEKRVRYWQQVVVDEIFDPSRNSIEDDSAISSIVDSVYEFCTLKYKKMGNGTYKNHEYGTEVQVVRAACKFFTICYMKEKGMKTKDIAEKLNMTVAGVNKNYREHLENKEEFFDLVKTFYGQHRFLEDETSVRFCEIIKEMFDLIGYEFTSEEERAAYDEDFIPTEEFLDQLFDLYAEWAVVEHSNGYLEYDKKYYFKPKIE